MDDIPNPQLPEKIGELTLREKQELDREGYLRHPQSLDEIRFWEAQLFWPDE